MQAAAARAQVRIVKEHGCFFVLNYSERSMLMVRYGKTFVSLLLLTVCAIDIRDVYLQCTRQIILPSQVEVIKYDCQICKVQNYIVIL